MRWHGVRLGGLALAIGLLSGCANQAVYQQGYVQPGYPGAYGYQGAYADTYDNDGVSWDDGIYGYGFGGYWGGYDGGYGHGHGWHGGGHGFGGHGFGGHGFGGGGFGGHGFGGGGFHGGGGGHGGGGHR
jgi:hypothetical protein